ncbi:MAG TPA: O-antigen ligase family protein [Thermoleophilaceae bacterium]|nr:O-antigen ligase family protein [Thermoleophilaceae bacterium]
MPGLLTAYTAFQAGGYFAGTPALLAVVVGLALVARITLAERPFEGLGGGLAVAAGALGLYCAWILLSATWSDAPARGLIDFDRALFYWLLLVLLGSLRWDGARLAWAVRGVALALVGVCAVALLTRLFPDAIDVATAVAEERLSYPLTYWNALGLMAAVGIVLCLHFTASEREPIGVRVLGAAALPLLATTLYFTFSRGAAGVAIIGVVAYAVVARPRSLILGLAAAGPATALALVSAYGADLLASDEPTSAAAAAQGGDLAAVLAFCIAGAAAVRALAAPADARLSAVRISAAARRQAHVVAIAAMAAVALVGAVVLDAPAKVADRVEGFAEQGNPSEEDDFRGRLTEPGNNGRIKQWEVGWDGFREQPLAGGGPGTFALLWARERRSDLKVEDGHSLYIETLAELGLVGGLLIAVALGALLVGFAVRARGEQRHLYAALLAAGLAWAIHAGIDWDWEMPAATLWLFGVGGVALAARRAGVGAWDPPRFARVALGAACLVLLVPPGAMALSQWNLNRSVERLKSDDCAGAIDAALAAGKALPVRPEPFEVLGYCDVRIGRADLGVEMLEAAVAREPENWMFHYGLALVRGAAGQDPRPAARRALELNPREELARDAVRRFRTDDPQEWRRRAIDARLPIL